MQKQEQQEQQSKERKSPSEIVLETLELVYGHAETGASLVVAVVVVEEAMIVVGHVKPRWSYEAKMVDDLAAASVVSILKANGGRKHGSA